MRQQPDALVLIAVYEFVTAAMLLLTSCVVLPFVLFLTPFASEDVGNFLGRFFFVALTLVLAFGVGIASAVVGVGLLMRREWARTGAIALAIPALLGFPIWTVIAILVIVYLVSDEGQALFHPGRRASVVARRSAVTVAPENVTEAPAGPAPPSTRMAEPADTDVDVDTTEAPTVVSPAEPPRRPPRLTTLDPEVEPPQATPEAQDASQAGPETVDREPDRG